MRDKTKWEVHYESLDGLTAVEYHDKSSFRLGMRRVRPLLRTERKWPDSEWPPKRISTIPVREYECTSYNEESMTCYFEEVPE